LQVVIGHNTDLIVLMSLGTRIIFAHIFPLSGIGYAYHASSPSLYPSISPSYLIFCYPLFGCPLSYYLLSSHPTSVLNFSDLYGCSWCWVYSFLVIYYRFFSLYYPKIYCLYSM